MVESYESFRYYMNQYPRLEPEEGGLLPAPQPENAGEPQELTFLTDAPDVIDYGRRDDPITGEILEMSYTGLCLPPN